MRLRPFSLVTRLTLLAGMLMTGTVLIFGFRNWQAGQARAVTQWQERLEHEANLTAVKVQGFIEQVGGDARYLARLPSVRDYTARPDQAGHRERMEEDFRALLPGRPVYAQVRLIGRRDGGREVMRLDQTADGITATPEARLQQKGDRDYLIESAGLPPGGFIFPSWI